MIWLSLALLAGLLLILVKSSDFFVDAVARIAKYMGVSEFVIGLTLIAIGTSLPELGTSLMACLEGVTELAVGNILGSNIANIGLILGLGAVMVEIKTNRQIFLRDCLILLGISLLFYFLALDGSLTFYEGLLLLATIPPYMAYLFKFKPHFRERLFRIEKYLSLSHRLNRLVRMGAPERKLAKDLKSEVYEDFVWKGFDIETYQGVRSRVSRFGKDILKDMAVMLGSGIAVYLSARYMVPVAVEVATHFGVTENVIGATIIAIGTSFPELSVSFSAARKGFRGMLLGNIVGSSIFNLALIGGLSAVVTPLAILPTTLYLSLPYMMLLTVVLFVFVRTRWRVKHYEGALLMGAYFLFLYLLLTNGGSLFML